MCIMGKESNTFFKRIQGKYASSYKVIQVSLLLWRLFWICSHRTHFHFAKVMLCMGISYSLVLSLSPSVLTSLCSCSVLYFSVHRYEDGAFWPHLKDSDSNVIGTGPGEGYNINLPWNQVCCWLGSSHWWGGSVMGWGLPATTSLSLLLSFLFPPPRLSVFCFVSVCLSLFPGLLTSDWGTRHIVDMACCLLSRVFVLVCFRVNALFCLPLVDGNERWRLPDGLSAASPACGLWGTDRRLKEKEKNWVALDKSVH